jgi:hypothetical protein
LLDRIWKICSNYEFIHEEIEKLKMILVKNEYPISVIDIEINFFLKRKRLELPNKATADKNKFYLVLPYIVFR